MLSIKNKIWLIGNLCGLLLFAAAVSSVQAAEVCKKVNGFPGASSIFITISTDTPQCKAAQEAFDSAVVIVTGKPDYGFISEKNEQLKNSFIIKSNPYVWVNDLANDPKYSAKFNEGLKFNDAVGFLKERIASNANDRQFAIDNAFMEVYGRASNAGEQARWDAQIKAQKAWYATIVTAEIGRLNSDPQRRTAMIEDVYQQTMGKTATPEEINYWKPRAEHFRLIVNANRNFLYSSNGNKDLVQTVRVAFLAKYKKDPTDKELKTALTKVADKKLIFEEMMSSSVSLR